MDALDCILNEIRRKKIKFKNYICSANFRITMDTWFITNRRGFDLLLCAILNCDEIDQMIEAHETNEYIINEVLKWYYETEDNEHESIKQK